MYVVNSWRVIVKSRDTDNMLGHRIEYSRISLSRDAFHEKEDKKSWFQFLKEQIFVFNSNKLI